MQRGVSDSADVLRKPAALTYWLNRWRPSHPVGHDPLQDVRVDDRYAPVSIANWKLIAPLRRKILALRVAHPLTFAADRRLTIVIPYRDREAHLMELLPELAAMLAAQGIRHKVLVVEQEPGDLFNRGKLINTGMQYAADTTDYYCIHDVDAVPVVADYRCPSQPLRLVHRILGPQGDPHHLLAASGRAQEGHRAAHYFSGAVSVCKSQAFAANGFSNEYRGWGKEDDDFFFRLLLAGFTCYYDTRGVFRDLPNPKDQQVQRSAGKVPPHVAINRKRRSRFLRGMIDPALDGLSTLRYQVVERAVAPSHEKIRVRWQS
jgi:hypothetical protein